MLITLIVAAITAAIDLFTKDRILLSLYEGESVPIIEGLLTFTHVHNYGAAYGLLGGQRWVLATLAVIICLGLVWYSYKATSHGSRIALGLVLGGAIGNLHDRIAYGYVVDFIQINPMTAVFQVFNVADMGITVGAGLLILSEWLNHREEPA